MRARRAPWKRAPSSSLAEGWREPSPSAMVEAPLSDTWSVSGSARYGLAQFVLPAAIRTFAPSASVGFVRYATAPSFVASTAVGIEP